MHVTADVVVVTSAVQVRVDDRLAAVRVRKRHLAGSVAAVEVESGVTFDRLAVAVRRRRDVRYATCRHDAAVLILGGEVYALLYLTGSDVIVVDVAGETDRLAAAVGGRARKGRF